MKKVKTIKVTEQDIENLVKKIIKEEQQLDEIGGYDSFELGSHHSDSTMEVIVNNYQNMVDSISELNTLRLDILDDKLARETSRLIGKVSPILEQYGKALRGAEKRRLDRFS